MPTPPAHKRPPNDLKSAVSNNRAADATWKDITPLARSEWICWATSAKKQETRARRIRITAENLAAGKRRPCCWPGCPHRS